VVAGAVDLAERPLALERLLVALDLAVDLWPPGWDQEVADAAVGEEFGERPVVGVGPGVVAEQSRRLDSVCGEGVEAASFEEIIYEGYGPSGVAIIVEAATDNKNRTAAEVRSIFTKNHGNLGSAGSVSYMFHKKGQIVVPRSSIDEERLLELVLEAGAEELTTEEDQYLIITSHDRLYAVADALKRANVTTDGQKFTFIPDSTVPVANEDVARQVLRLCEALEEDDDVQNVYSNLDIPDEMLAKLPA